MACYLFGLERSMSNECQLQVRLGIENGQDPPIVIRSPNERAIPWVLLRIRTCPVMVPASVRSTLKFARASSPVRVTYSQYEGNSITEICVLDLPNKLRAYRFPDKKSQSPERAPSGVRHAMFVTFITC